jgi:hypothetical protein
MSKPRLSKSAIQLREQIDDAFIQRDRKSDGWIADVRHMREGKSDHIPDAQGWVRAIDIDRDLSGQAKPDIMPDLADEIRVYAKRDRKRISYIIFDGRIASGILNWKWRTYKGANKHNHHVHVSFKKEADNDGSFFQIPMLGGTHDSGN